MLQIGSEVLADTITFYPYSDKKYCPLLVIAEYFSWIYAPICSCREGRCRKMAITGM